MLRIGVPAGAEFVLLFVYILLVYAIIRGFGPEAQAGFGIGARVMQALFLPVVALSFAAAPVVGQNFGGRRADRVRHSVYPAIGIASLMTLVLTLIVAYTDCAFCTCNPDSHFLTRRASDCLRQRLPADRFIEFHLGRNRLYIVKCVSRNRQHTAASV